MNFFQVINWDEGISWLNNESAALTALLSPLINKIDAKEEILKQPNLRGSLTNQKAHDDECDAIKASVSRAGSQRLAQIQFGANIYKLITELGFAKPLNWEAILQDSFRGFRAQAAAVDKFRHQYYELRLQISTIKYNAGQPVLEVPVPDVIINERAEADALVAELAKVRPEKVLITPWTIRFSACVRDSASYAHCSM